MLIRTPISALLVFLFLLLPLSVMAQDIPDDEMPNLLDENNEKRKFEESENGIVMTGSAGPHWLNFIWRSGIGYGQNSLKLTYKNPPKGLEDSFTMSGDDLTDLHMPSLWFFPTSSRDLMVSFGLAAGSGKGTFHTSDTGGETLDGKPYWRGYWMIPAGIGYRWLLGLDENFSLQILGEVGYSYNAIYMKGLEGSADTHGVGGGALLSFHYRYHNGFLVGLGLEYKGFWGEQSSAKLIDYKADVEFSGHTGYLSLMLGYEPW